MNSIGSLRLGYMHNGNASDGTKSFSLAAGARWEAFSFILPEDKTLNTIKWFIDSKTGSPASGSIRLDIYSDTSNAPNATLANSTTTSGSFANKTWVSQTGYSLALTAGTRYWIVIRNVDGAPTTNYVDIRYLEGSMGCAWSQYSAVDASFRMLESVNSGSFWGNDNREGTFPFRLDFSDGTYFGFPVGEKVRALEGVAGQGVYSSRAFGCLITTPANASFKVKGVSFQIGKSGTPTGSARCQIYQGTNLVSGATSNLLLPASIPSAGGIFTFFFPTSITLASATAYRIVVSESTQSDTSSNRYMITSFKNIDSDSNSQALKPWGATAAATYYDGSSWADDTTQIVPLILHLDSSGEFASAGGGVKNSNSVSGGAQ